MSCPLLLNLGKYILCCHSSVLDSSKQLKQLPWLSKDQNSFVSIILSKLFLLSITPLFPTFYIVCIQFNIRLAESSIIVLKREVSSLRIYSFRKFFKFLQKKFIIEERSPPFNSKSNCFIFSSNSWILRLITLFLTKGAIAIFIQRELKYTMPMPLSFMMLGFVVMS